MTTASPAWGEAARQVVAYRTVYDIRGDDPLGPTHPNQPGRQLQAWQAAHHAITACTPPHRPSAVSRGTAPRPPHRPRPGHPVRRRPPQRQTAAAPAATSSMTTTKGPPEMPHVSSTTNLTTQPHRQPERVEDLPLILEQLLDQLDDLQQAVEAQQRLIALLTSRVAALEHRAITMTERQPRPADGRPGWRSCTTGSGKRSSSWSRGSSGRPGCDFARGFHRYWFNNLILIWAQRPDATAVASYRTWQAKGRQVRKGETAHPGPGPDPAPHPDPRRPRPAGPGEDGTPRTRQQVCGFRPVPVFDLAQTDGPPIPEPARPVLLAGDAPAGLWDALAREVSRTRLPAAPRHPRRPARRQRAHQPDHPRSLGPPRRRPRPGRQDPRPRTRPHPPPHPTRPSRCRPSRYRAQPTASRTAEGWVSCAGCGRWRRSRWPTW